MEHGWLRDEKLLFNYEIVIHNSSSKPSRSIRDVISSHMNEGYHVTSIILPKPEYADMRMSTQALYALAENDIIQGEKQFALVICCPSFTPILPAAELDFIRSQIPSDALTIDLASEKGQQQAFSSFGLKIIDEGDMSWALACDGSPYPSHLSLFAEDVSAMAISLIEQELKMPARRRCPTCHKCAGARDGGCGRNPNAVREQSLSEHNQTSRAHETAKRRRRIQSEEGR